MARIEMHLLDGRVIDFSDLTVDEWLARVRALGITPDMVKETRHYIPAGVVPVIVCQRCGLRSYNPNDIREKYCARCHEFEDP